MTKFSARLVGPPPRAGRGPSWDRDAKAPASGEVFELLDLPRIEDDATDLVATREHVQLALELTAVLEHHSDDPAVLGKELDVAHGRYLNSFQIAAPTLRCRPDRDHGIPVARDTLRLARVIPRNRLSENPPRFMLPPQARWRGR
jgi:hypothetical protein